MIDFCELLYFLKSRSVIRMSIDKIVVHINLKEHSVVTVSDARSKQNSDLLIYMST